MTVNIRKFQSKKIPPRISPEAVQAVAVDLGDNGTRELFESTLKDEEDHIDWIEAQLDQIKQMGIQVYLGEQVG